MPRRSSGPASSAASSCSNAASRASACRRRWPSARTRPPASPARPSHPPVHTEPMTASKVATMRDAIAELVRDGDTVAIEGFTHLISFAAGHEIIRQGRRDLTLARLTPDLVYDQMVAAGVARKLVFSWLGNPGVGGLHAIRRRIEATDQTDADGAAMSRLELEEYSHFGMVARYTAGAANLPFFPLRSYFETDLPVANPLIRQITSPYGDEVVYAVPPLKPDVIWRMSG